MPIACGLIQAEIEALKEVGITAVPVEIMSNESITDSDNVGFRQSTSGSKWYLQPSHETAPAGNFNDKYYSKVKLIEVLKSIMSETNGA